MTPGDFADRIPESWIPRSWAARSALFGLALRLVLVAVIGTGLTVAVYQPVSADWFWLLVQWGRIALIPPQFLLFGIWMNEVRKGLEEAGVSGFKYGAGWTIGGFFVPVLNFFRPFQVASELWKASDPDAPPRPEAGLSWASAGPDGSAAHLPRESGLPTIVWWALFWISQSADALIDAAYDAGFTITAEWQYHVLDGIELSTEFAWLLASAWLIAVMSQRARDRAASIPDVDADPRIAP